MIQQAIHAGIQSFGGPSGVPVGVREFYLMLDAGTRIVVRGMWDGTNFKIGTAFIQIFENGQWVMYAP